MNMFLTVAIGAACLFAGAAPAAPEQPRFTLLPGVPAVSGMAAIDVDGKASESRYIVVHDSKRGTATPPLGLLTFLTTSAPAYQPLRAEGENDLNDVEAIAPIPGRPGEYLLMESGGGVEARRLVPLRLRSEAGATMARLDLPGAIELKPRGTRDGRNVESLVVLPAPHGFRAYYANREADKDDRQTLRFLAADLDQSLSLLPESRPDQDGGLVRLPAVLEKGWRICSDLAIDDPQRPGTLYVSAALDEDVDFGPFVSRVFSFTISIESGRIVASSGREIASIPGMKVEAVCLSGASRRLLLVSDDEFLGASLGAVRLD